MSLHDFGFGSGGAEMVENDMDVHNERGLDFQAWWLLMNAQHAGKKLTAYELSHDAFYEGVRLASQPTGERVCGWLVVGLVFGLAIGFSIGLLF